jgi:hypothetical protein
VGTALTLAGGMTVAAAAPLQISGAIAPNADGTYTLGTNPTIGAVVSAMLLTQPRQPLGPTDYSVAGNVLTLATPNAASIAVVWTAQ